MVIKLWNKYLGRTQNLQADFNMAKIIDAEHSRVHEGVMFSSSDVRSIANNGNLDLIVVTSNASVHLRAWDFNSMVGPCEIRLYEQPYLNPSSMGTQLPLYNRNRRSSNVASVSLWEAPYINPSSIGTMIDFNLIEQSTGGPIKTNGGPSESYQEWELATDRNYLLRCTNVSGGAGGIEFDVVLYEDNR